MTLSKQHYCVQHLFVNGNYLFNILPRKTPCLNVIWDIYDDSKWWKLMCLYIYKEKLHHDNRFNNHEFFQNTVDTLIKGFSCIILYFFFFKNHPTLLNFMFKVNLRPYQNIWTNSVCLSKYFLWVIGLLDFYC